MVIHIGWSTDLIVSASSKVMKWPLKDQAYIWVCFTEIFLFKQNFTITAHFNYIETWDLDSELSKVKNNVCILDDTFKGSHKVEFTTVNCMVNNSILLGIIPGAIKYWWKKGTRFNNSWQHSFPGSQQFYNILFENWNCNSNI